MSGTDQYYDQYWDRAEEIGRVEARIGEISPWEQDMFNKVVKEGDFVVDYGCGPADRCVGHIESLGAQYRGFDISQGAIERGRARGVDCHVLNEDGMTSCEDSSADIVINFEVLEHLMKPSAAVEEFYRILKPGGHCIISVPNAGYWTARIEFLLTGFLCPNGVPKTCRTAPWDDAHIRFFTPKTLKMLFSSSGFDSLSCSSAAPFNIANLPVLYRLPIGRRINKMTEPFLGGLSKVFPSLFAARLFLVAQKPV